MKRYGNLWLNIITFENLYNAHRKAQRGKRYRSKVLEFNHDLEGNLLQLQRELENQTYKPGEYRTFLIQEPKIRMISAAPYRDRVVHHALCTWIGPILEETLIPDTYANRVGFGSHRALKRFTKFCRSSPYIFQCDIAQYFPSLDHEILKSLIRRKIKCENTLWLIDLLIDNSNPQHPVFEHFPGDTLLTPLERRRGLPIGNLTSQMFANFYLSGFDHFVKETLGFSKYLRYVDDFALFAEQRTDLRAARPQIEAYLATLRLKIHPIKSQITKTQRGANFVGYRVLPHHIRIRRQNLHQARKRHRHQLHGLSTQPTPTDLATFQTSLQSWFAHLSHANSYRLQKEILTFLAKRNIKLTVLPKITVG